MKVVTKVEGLLWEHLINLCLESKMVDGELIYLRTNFHRDPSEIVAICDAQWNFLPPYFKTSLWGYSQRFYIQKYLGPQK